GVAILIRKNLPFQCLSQVTDPAGRFVVVHGRWGAKPITFASMYAPNIDDPLLAQFPSPWVIGGDFNCPLDTVKDRSSSVQVAQTLMAKTILASMKEYGLMDVWWHLRPTAREYSFYSHAHQTFSHIDFFFLFLPCSVIKYISDHSPLWIQLEAPEDIQGPFRWRFNLLTQDDFVGEIRLAIQEFFHLNHSPQSSPDVVWEAFKAMIRGKIIAFSSACKKSFQQQMARLEQELREAETELYKSNSAENRESVALLQHNLNELSSSRAERALLRIRSKFYARGDRAGKLLTWQLRQEEADRLIPSIRLLDDTISFALEAINGAFQNYCSILYSIQYDKSTMSSGSLHSF
uniref:Endonuclease/exonuclease/phosphatase domain-containing protein n=1 Tax=Latimeria chalumnae TaxID=7897 RepID=H3ATQ6_LATCH